MPGTIGYRPGSDAGMTSDATAGNWDKQAYFESSGLTYTAAAGDTVTLVGVWGDGGGTPSIAVYETSGGTIGAKVGSNVNVTVAAGSQEHTAVASIALSAGTTYTIGLDYWLPGGESWNMRFVAGPGGAQMGNNASGSALPDPWATNNGTDTGRVYFFAVVEGASDTADITLADATVSASGVVVNPAAVLYVKEVGFVTDTTAGTTSTITVAAGGVPVNDTVVVYGACDNTGGGGAATTITVTDTRGNTYNTQSPTAIADPGAASAGQQGFFAVARISTALQAGDTITITYGNSTTAKAINAQQFTGANLSAPVLSGSYTTQNSQTGTSNSVSTAPTAVGQAVCALIAVEGGTADGFTQDSDTTDGAWETLTRRGSGTTTGGSTLNSVYKLVTGTTAQTYNPTLGTSRDHCAAILVLDVEVGVTGTAAVTLGAATSSASGTVAGPDVSGTASITLGAATSTASGTHTPPPITGTGAVTLAAATSSASGSLFTGLYPASISGRHLLDQNGDPFLLFTFSSWSLADLSDADITQALEDVATNGFTGITAWAGGGYSINSTWDPPYERKANDDDWWTGTPWASSLGPAWSAIDHIAAETARLGLVFTLSICGGFSTTGAGPDWESVTNTNMHDVGVAVATRYASYPHIIWHVMFDDTHDVASTRGQRADAYMDGINDTEGATARPVRWCEQSNSATTDDQGWYDPTGSTTAARFSINCIYSYDSDSVTDFETAWAQTSGPTGDCEPRYVGNAYTTGNTGQQFRERNYAVPLEGGSLINFGHEDWWPFGKTGLFTDGETWDTVVTDTEVVQAGHAWTLAKAYCADITYAPTSAFVTTGQGTGDAKAAQGASDAAALAYFPDNRTIAVDTTIIAGTSPVRLRWYDPTAGTFSTIAASEAQQTGRSVTLPAARGDGTRDFVLVVEAVNDVVGTAAVTLGTATSAASGTHTPPAFTGTAAVTLADATATASGTHTPPAFTGTASITLAPATADASGTHTPPAITGTVAVDLTDTTADASGTHTPPAFTGTAAVTLDAATSDASGTHTPPAFTGTATIALGAATSTASGTFIPEGSGAGSVTLAAATVDASGTVTLPEITGSAAVTLAAATADASGTHTAPGFSGTAAVILAAATATADGTVITPNVDGAAAITLGPAVALGTGEHIAPPIVGTAAIILGAVVVTAVARLRAIPVGTVTATVEQVEVNVTVETVGMDVTVEGA